MTARRGERGGVHRGVLCVVVLLIVVGLSGTRAPAGFAASLAPGAPVPPPPTPADIWPRVPLPHETVTASPPGSRAWPGIVHIESWFWGVPIPGVEVSFAVGGYAVAVVAHPIAYQWSFGDGRTVVGPTPGSQSVPVRDTYRRRGDYDVTLSVTWGGRALMSSPASGINSLEQDLGTFTAVERIVYHVAEVRAVLRSRGAGR